MGDIRILKPGRGYELTHTLVDREFSFRPDHRRDNALLHEDCPAEALDAENELTPDPSLINIIGYAFARAAQLSPIASEERDIFSPAGRASPRSPTTNAPSISCSTA